MMESVIAKSGAINPSALQELLEKNAIMPDIRHVVFNVKTHEAVRDSDGKKLKDANGNVQMVEMKNPILATEIEFVDNTKVVVKNSVNDKVDLVTVMLDINGNVTTDPTKSVKTVTTASEASKELGIVYGIWKRIVGSVDNRGTVSADGAGRILRNVVTSAHDSAVESAKNILKREASKAKHEETHRIAHEKAEKNPSLAKTVRDLYANVEKLTAIVEALAAKTIA